MGILFISHSSRDNEAARKVSHWLKENGWGEVFLDLDPEQGLAAGQRWQQELKQAGERCSGVVVLLSPDWIASRWCQTEFLIADQLGKKIFPVFVAPTNFDDLPLELRAKFQIVDISTPGKEAEGFARLAIGLKRSGLDPKSFPWPPPNDPHRPIYRGLEALEEEDAAIFFGRDALITKALDAMRRMRDGARERVLVILGASGAGKSSFLRAGLVARLKRDEENFLVLPIMRPERAALTGSHGLAASIGCDAARLNDSQTIPQLFARMRERATQQLKRFAVAQEGEGPRPPTIVIAVDQAEEFFGAENAEARQALDLLLAALQVDRNAIVIATIRSDSFAKVQGRPRLAEVPLLPFNLPPIPLGAFKEVIEGPARLANPPLSIEPALIDRLLHDLSAEDALPLLALTLERLSSRQRRGGTLTLAEYAEKLGGLQGAIVGAVDAAFTEARRDPRMPQSHAELEKLARDVFIPCLVHLDDADAEPRRRVERLAALPEATQPLVRHLINQRLLVSNRSVINGVETDTVEVTHEAILRQWPALRAWIAEERDALRTLDSVRSAATEWQAHRKPGSTEQEESWLVHRGSRLLEAEALLVRAGFADAFGSVERSYLAACRSYENDELLREQRALARTRRLQRIITAVVAAAAVVVLLAGFGITQLLAGIAATTSNTLATQSAKAAEENNYERSARYALAAIGAHWLSNGTGDNDTESDLRFAISATSAIGVLIGHDHQVLYSSFSPDGTKIVTASRDRTARIWDAKTALPLLVLKGHSDAVDSAAFSPDGKRVVTSSEDKTVRVWDALTGREILVLRGHTGTVYTAVFSPDSNKILTGSDDQTARLWDAQSGASLAVFHLQSAVESAEFSGDGKNIVIACDDKTARIWNVATGEETQVFRGHGSLVNFAAFSPDGRFVATASDDTTARIWDVRTGQQLASLEGHTNGVSSVAFNPDGTRVATASRDGTTRLWDVRSGHEEALLRGHGDVVNSVAFSPDGQRLVTASDDRTARIWDTNAHVIVLRGHEDIVNGVAFSRDGNRVATASSDGSVRLWDPRTGAPISLWRGHTNLVESVAFSADGTRVVSGSDDRTARVWDVRSGRLLMSLRGSEGAIYGVAFDPEGKRIATASTDKEVRLWGADTGKLLQTLRGHTGAIFSVQYDPQGSRLVTSSSDGTARIWDAVSGRLLAILRGQGGRVRSASFSPNGKLVVTAGPDKTAAVWDAETGRTLLFLRGHTDFVMGAAFSPDGKRIITASHDKTARIWDAKTGAQIAVLRGHARQIDSVAFSSDGKWALTGAQDNTARIWNVSNILATTRDDLLRTSCQKVLVRGLSRFSADEIRAAPVLDSKLDADVCHPAGAWARLARIFRAGFSR